MIQAQVLDVFVSPDENPVVVLDLHDVAIHARISREEPPGLWEITGLEVILEKGIGLTYQTIQGDPLKRGDEVFVGPQGIEKWCCTFLKEEMTSKCALHPDSRECPDKLMYRNPKGQWGLIYHDDGYSYSVIHYCPWCGSKLPTKLKNGASTG